MVPVRDVDQLLAFEVLVFQHGQLVRVEKVLERLMVWVRVDLFTRPKNPNCLSQSLRTMIAKPYEKAVF